jgi:hypothetical protein
MESVIVSPCEFQQSCFCPGGSFAKTKEHHVFFPGSFVVAVNHRPQALNLGNGVARRLASGIVASFEFICGKICESGDYVAHAAASRIAWLHRSTATSNSAL